MFHSWLLLVRGVLRRTGPRGVSVRATGAWELPPLWEAWSDGGLVAVHHALEAADAQAMALARGQVGYGDQAARGAAASRSARPVVAAPDLTTATTATDKRRGGMGGSEQHRRVLVHASGFRQSPYADIKPAGDDAKTAPRKLWHASPGSSGQ